MTVLKAEPVHVAEVQRWLLKRSGRDLPADMLSSTGYIVPGAAAVWLYLTDSSMAYLEFLVSNPDAPKAVRRAGIARVLARAVEEAKLAGTRLLACSVTRDDVEAYAVAAGFGVRAREASILTMTLGGA